MVADWAGSYRQKKISYSGSRGKRVRNISFEEVPILQASELTTLGGTDELILISNESKYNMIKKTPYYSDPVIRQLWDDLRRERNGGKHERTGI